MIDSRIHARELVEYVLFKSTEKEKDEIIKNSMLNVKRFGFRIDEEVFFEEIVRSREGSKFMQAKQITSLEELIFVHYEWKMKYCMGLFRNVSPMVDFNEDELDDTFFLD